MKIGIDNGEDLKFHLEDDGGDVVVVDSDGIFVVRFQIDNKGKVYLSTKDDINISDKYAIRKGRTDIEVIL